MTVGELRALLAQHPDDMPVVAEWEGQRCFILPKRFRVQKIGTVGYTEESSALIIDVNDY